MADGKNEVALTFSEQLTTQLASVESALPKDFNRTRFVQNALSVLNSNTDLQKCNKATILQGLLRGAYLGLDFANKECYLIPYGQTATFQTDYKGEIKFVKRYSIRPIRDIYAEIVRQGDTYEKEVIDGEIHYTFKPLPFNGNDIAGAFAVCVYEDGGIQLEEMTVDEINAVRNNYSKQSGGKPWKVSYGEMAKKVVLRRLCKHINTDFETTEAREAWEEGSGMDFSKKVVPTGQVFNAFAKKDPDETEEPNTEDEEGIIDGVAEEVQGVMDSDGE